MWEKNRAKLVLVIFAGKWLGLKKFMFRHFFHPAPSHNPVRPLLTFIKEENFGNETSGHHINI